MYRESNFTGEQGRNEEVGTPDFTLNGLTVNDPYYIRVYNFTDASSSEFKIRVY